MRVRSAQHALVTCPLREPYVLSFGTVTEIAGRIIEIELEDDRRAVGEAVALPGYSDETDGQIGDALAAIAPALGGLDESAARLAVDELGGGCRFARSAAHAALDVAFGGFAPPARVDVPLLAPTATAQPEKMVHRCRALHAEGFGTIKVKIGRDVDADIAGASALLEQVSGLVRLRFDANQAYDLDSARRFLASLDRAGSECVELVEQPLPVGDWKGMAELTAKTPVPLMLDESIYDEADVRRAAQVGAKFVKLKLFKHAGIVEVLSLARMARELGLDVILGNGVSSDIGNLMEAWAYASEEGLFHGASEGNGFAKLRRPLLKNPPNLDHGRLKWHMPATGDPLALAELRPG